MELAIDCGTRHDSYLSNSCISLASLQRTINYPQSINSFFKTMLNINNDTSKSEIFLLTWISTRDAYYRVISDPLDSQTRW